MIRLRYLTLPLLALLALGCEETDEASQGITLPDPPAGNGVYGYANGCYSVEGFDGAAAPRQVAADGDVYAFSATDAAGAAKFRMRATDLGTYLFYDTEKHYLTAQLVEGSAPAEYRFSRVVKLDSDIELLDDTFRSPAEWEIAPSTRDAKRYQLKHYQSGLYLGVAGLTSDEAQAAIITLFPAENCAEFPELTLDATGSISKTQWDDGDLYGYAELHSHMMTNFGFGGGGIFHGAPFHRLGVEHALPDCSPFHGSEGRKDAVGYFYDNPTSLDLDKLLPIATTGEVPEFNHFTAGYPDFTEWPNSWKLSTHQTMYYKWLERAYLGGMRLMVQLATGNSVLCDLMTGIGSQSARYSCNDMVSVERTIQEVRNLERYIDAQSGGPGKGWFKVVESPAEARAAVKSGKLAVVLGIEISNLFDCFLTPPEGFDKCTPDSVRGELDKYEALGVRVIFPVHKYDNGFTSGDGSDGIIELGNFINSGHDSSFVEACPGISTTFDGGGVTFGGLNKPRAVYDSPAPYDMSGFAASPVGTLLPYLKKIQEPALTGEYCQSFGFTPLGETLMQEMMLRGMLIDIAHLPQRSLARAYEILEAADYPATKTHGNSNDGRLYALGGMRGAEFGRCGDPANPGQMGAGYRATIQELVENASYPAEGFSFDLNGFAGGPRPRFGADSGCQQPQANPITYPFTSYDGAITFTQPHLGSREVDFNTEGMIHVGLLPEYIEDARRDGMTDDAIEPLFRSAEAYIRMWERVESRAAALKK